MHSKLKVQQYTSYPSEGTPMELSVSLPLVTFVLFAK